MRIRRQILRWVDKGSQDGYTDQTVISTIGMKGEDKALGYTWDYRNYGARNPQAYNDPKLFEEYSRQDKPEYRIAQRDERHQNQAGRAEKRRACAERCRRADELCQPQSGGKGSGSCRHP